MVFFMHAILSVGADWVAPRNFLLRNLVTILRAAGKKVNHPEDLQS